MLVLMSLYRYKKEEQSWCDKHLQKTEELYMGAEHEQRVTGALGNTPFSPLPLQQLVVGIHKSAVP